MAALIGHLIATAVVFIVLVCIGWLVSIVPHVLNRYHAFPDEIFRFITRIELHLICADVAMGAVVLGTGAVGLCKQLWRSNDD